MNAPSPLPKKRLSRLREHLRGRHYSIRTQEAYAEWAKCLILFRYMRHPQDMGAALLSLYKLRPASELSARLITLARPE